jgi:hypothetical protein
MAHGVDSTKTPARPSHEAIEPESSDVTERGKSEQHKMDRVAMESAKRAGNREVGNEETNSSNSVFSK